jgi:hypothetical protein
MRDPGPVTGKKILFWDDPIAGEGLQPLLDALGISLGHKQGQPRNHIRHDVSPTDRLELSRALQIRSVTNPTGGEVLMGYMGYAECRICGKRLGTRDFYGNGFVWPELAEHYIIAHQVWTPGCSELLAAVRRSQRRTP